MADDNVERADNFTVLLKLLVKKGILTMEEYEQALDAAVEREIAQRG
jgi:hypothetical protein